MSVKKSCNFQCFYKVEDETFTTVSVPTETAVYCHRGILDFECIGTFSYYDFSKIVYFEVALHIFKTEPRD